MGLLHFFHMQQQQHGRSGCAGPSKFCFQRMLPLLQIYKCPCRAETVLQFRCLLQLIQLGACSIQAFCTSEQFLLFVVRNLFQTAAWDPSALDLPRISRAGVWLTGVLLTLMWNSVSGCSVLVRVNKQDNVTLTTIYRRHRGRSASVELWTEKESGGWRYLRVSLSVCVRICQTCECVCAWEREKQWGGYSSLTQLTVLEDPSSDPGTATQRCQAQHTQVGHTEQLRGQVGLAQVM